MTVTAVGCGLSDLPVMETTIIGSGQLRAVSMVFGAATQRAFKQSLVANSVSIPSTFAAPFTLSLSTSGGPVICIARGEADFLGLVSQNSAVVDVIPRLLRYSSVGTTVVAVDTLTLTYDFGQNAPSWKLFQFDAAAVGSYTYVIEVATGSRELSSQGSLEWGGTLRLTLVELRR